MKKRLWNALMISALAVTLLSPTLSWARGGCGPRGGGGGGGSHGMSGGGHGGHQRARMGRCGQSGCKHRHQCKRGCRHARRGFSLGLGLEFGGGGGFGFGLGIQA